jgi:hypothetical protein
LVVAGHLSEEGFGRRHGQRHNGLYVTALSACIHGTASLLHSTAFNACIQGTSLLHSTSWSKTQRTIYYCLLCMYTFSKVLYLGTLHNQLNRDFNFLKSPLYRDKKIYKTEYTVLYIGTLPEGTTVFTCSKALYIGTLPKGTAVFTFSKALHIGTLPMKYTRVQTFEDLSKVCFSAPHSEKRKKLLSMVPSVL